MQPVSVYPPVDVPAGQWVYISIDQPSYTSVPFGIGVDTGNFTQFGTPGAPGTGIFRPRTNVENNNADFLSTNGTSLTRVQVGCPGACQSGVPMIRAGFKYPVTVTQLDVPVEQGMPFMQRLFDKPVVATSGNSKKLRPIEPLADAILAVLLPLDIDPKPTGNPATEIPASCDGPVGGTGTPNLNSVYLPAFFDQQSPTPGVRRQKCDYFTQAFDVNNLEMEQGLGCAPTRPECFNSTVPTALPECFADPELSAAACGGNAPCCTGTTCKIACTETVRGMEPVDLDASGDYATPFELFIPLARRLILGVYSDPTPNDNVTAPGPLVCGQVGAPDTAGYDCIDPDIVLFDTFPFFELLVSRIPALSDDEAAALNGEATMTSLIDRLLVLPKILTLASDDPSLDLYRFFDNPADKTCGGVPSAEAKCDAVTANLFDVLSAFSEPVVLRDRVTGITGPAEPILVRLLNDYIDAFFPEPKETPTLPAQDLPPRIELTRTSTQINIREGYGQGGVDDPLHCTEYDGTSTYFRGNCNYYIDLTVNHGQLSMASEFADAVVSVSVPDDVEAGKANALHVAAFNDTGRINGSLMAYRVWKADYPEVIEDGDYLEYGILIPSISHVKNAAVDVMFNGVSSGNCVLQGHGWNNTETARQFDNLPSSLNNLKNCLRDSALRFANKTDQAGRPAEASFELTDAGDTFIFRRIPLFKSNPNAEEGNFIGKDMSAADANSGVYLTFDTSNSAARGRAEAYVSFIRIVNANKAWNGALCDTVNNPSGSVTPECLQLLVYNGGAGLLAGSALAANTGYAGIDEYRTCTGLPGSCTGTGSPTLNTRQREVLCPSGVCPAAPACGSQTAVGGSGAGFRLCDSADGALRFRTDASGRVSFPIKASMIPHLSRIQVQVRCGDTTVPPDGDCEEQENPTILAVAQEIARAGDSAPVIYTVDTRYGPRPLSFSFETLDQSTRPVYQNTAISDPSITNTKAGEPAEDDAFFLDTRVVDQKGTGFTGFVRLPCERTVLPNACDPGAATPLSTTSITMAVDYAVVRRPALELRAQYNASTAPGFNVVGAGDDSSTGPFISQAGDYLEYEVYIPNAGGNNAANAPNAGIDIQSATPNDGSRDLRDGAVLGAPTPVTAGQPGGQTDTDILASLSGNSTVTSGRPLDQNLRISDPRAELTTTGAPNPGTNFYYRRMPVPEGFVIARGDADKSSNLGSRVFASLWAFAAPGAASLSDAYFRQIRIGNSGTPKYSIFDDQTGRRLLRLSGSPCNDYYGGSRSDVCPDGVPGEGGATPAACPDGPDGGTAADPGFAMVFTEFTGLNVSTDGQGDTVVLMSGPGPCWGNHNHNAAANNHDATTCYTVTPGDVGALHAKTSNADAGLAWPLIWRDGADAAQVNGRRIEACDVSRDPVIIFKGAPIGWDWTNGAAIRLNRQRTSRPYCETQRDNGGVDATECDAGTGITAGYDYSALCATTQFRIGSTEGSGYCVPYDPQPAAGDYGQAVGDGRFCPNGAGAAQYGQRCASGNMSVILNPADAVTDYTAGRSHTVQRAKSVSGDASLYRFVYTMGVSSGTQTVEVRQDKSSATIDALDPSTERAIEPYAYLLDTEEFTVTGNPPPVPSQIVFAYEPEEETNGLTGVPYNGGACVTDTGTTDSCQDIQVQVQDQYGNAWTKSIPLTWKVTSPKNAIRMRGTPTRSGAFLGLKLNVGIMNRPRWEYPLAQIGNTRDADATNTIVTAATGAGGENNDIDKILEIASTSTPTGLMPGDTVRIGLNAGDVFTATVRNVFNFGTVERIEFDDIYYLSADCGTYDAPAGIDPNLRPGAFTTCGGAAASLNSVQIFVTNPLTKGDDFPCNESGAYGGLYGSPPTCEDYSRFGTCVGGNFNRGADGAWRRVTQYKGDDDCNDGSPTELERHCYEQNFAPATTFDPNGGNTGVTGGSIYDGRDVSIGDVRFEYGSFGDGIEGGGNCAYSDGQSINQAGAIAWNCIPGTLRQTVLYPNDGVNLRGHAGVEFAGLRQYSNRGSPTVGCGLVGLGATFDQPQTSSIRNWFNSYTTGQYINPHTSTIQIGLSSARVATDPLTVWGEATPGLINGQTNSANKWERGDIDQFYPYDPSASNTYQLDVFTTRTLILPRASLWMAEPTVTRLTCGPGSNTCNTSGSYLDSNAGLAGAQYAYVRNGVWMAMTESSAAGSSSVNQPYDFFLSNLSVRSANDFSLLISANVAGLGDLAQPAAIPFFFNDNFYDGSTLLPSTKVSNYGQNDTGAGQETPNGTADNDGAFGSVDIRVAGAHVKACSEPGTTLVLPKAMAGTTRLPMAGNCANTADGQSRPGGIAVARTNDPFNRNGRMTGRVFFPPWPNDKVQIEVSAPGVPPLVYKRSIVRSGGVPSSGNQPPTAVAPNLVGTPPCNPVIIGLSGDDPEGSNMTVNVTSLPSQGTLAPQTGTIADGGTLSVTYTPAGGDPACRGTFVFEYTVTDDQGAVSAPFLVAISVNPQPTISVGAPNPRQVCEDLTVGGACASQQSNSFTFTGAGGTPPLSINITEVPANGIVDATTGTSPLVVAYTPDPNFCGADTFRAVAVGSDLGVSTPVTVTVNVTCVNDAPSAFDVSTTGPRNTALPVVLSGSDVETPLSGLTVRMLSVPGGIGGTLSGFTCSPAWPTVPCNITPVGAPKTVTYNPPANTSGIATFTYVIRDGAGVDSAPATVSILVNNPPVATPPAPVTTAEDTTSGNITLTGTDTESAAGTLTVVLVRAPAFGVLNGGCAPTPCDITPAGVPKTVTFTPGLNYFGGDSFEFLIRDPSGAESAPPTQVDITVTSVNDRPNTPTITAPTGAVSGTPLYTTPYNTSTCNIPDNTDNEPGGSECTPAALTVNSGGVMVKPAAGYATQGGLNTITGGQGNQWLSDFSLRVTRGGTAYAFTTPAVNATCNLTDTGVATQFREGAGGLIDACAAGPYAPQQSFRAAFGILRVDGTTWQITGRDNVCGSGSCGTDSCCDRFGGTVGRWRISFYTSDDSVLNGAGANADITHSGSCNGDPDNTPPGNTITNWRWEFPAGATYVSGCTGTCTGCAGSPLICNGTGSAPETLVIRWSGVAAGDRAANLYCRDDLSLDSLAGTKTIYVR
ncbi:MAG: Ig-like domain-containing protein [Bdellovibrionota bacterium]